MISFSRTLLVGAEFLDENTLRFHGILEDHIYAMEIQMDVRTPEGVVVAIEGRMKRYTTPVCPKAADALQKAVGLSLRGEKWISKVNREIGRGGCQHLAEILIECGRCLDQARMAHAVGVHLQKDPGADPTRLARAWVEANPEARGACQARP